MFSLDRFDRSPSIGIGVQIHRCAQATHQLPISVGSVQFNVKANSTDAYRRLLTQFVDFYAGNLLNPAWGEQVGAGPDNRLDVRMVFQGLSLDQAKETWRPLVDFVRNNSADYSSSETFTAAAIPARKFWDPNFMKTVAASAIRTDDRAGAVPDRFWWTGDGEQVGAFWYAYSSIWLPASLLLSNNRSRLVDAWFEASRHTGVSFHFNKGLAGAPPEVIAAARNTATNPEVTEAFALAIVASAGPPSFDGLPQPNLAYAAARRKVVGDTMTALRVVAPAAGAYVNECDFFQAEWQRSFWGSNYARLAQIKRRYDPEGLFVVHHGVGSEDWSEDGFVSLN